MSIPFQLASLYDGQEAFVWSDCLLDLGTDFLVLGTLRYHFISMAYVLLLSSAVKVHDLQAYRKMDVTRERISCTLELREILLSFQTGFNCIETSLKHNITDHHYADITIMVSFGRSVIKGDVNTMNKLLSLLTS